MEQLTLTGGTLLETNNNNSNTQHQHSHSHDHASSYSGDPLSMETPHPTPGGKPQIQLSADKEVELSKLVLKSTTPHYPAYENTCQHDHDHSHGHSHSHEQQQPSHVQQGTSWQIQTPNGKTQPMPVPVQAMSLMVPLEQVMKGTREEIMSSVSTLLRLGPYDKWRACVELVAQRERDEQTKGNPKADPDDPNNNNNDNNDWSKPWWTWVDGNGHTLLHWAAKRGDDKSFVQFFVEQAPPAILKQLVHQTSYDSTGMTPIHWACTEPGAQSLGILALFLDGIPHFPVNLEVRDASGCTPLLIAAQYGQVEVCAYLLQRGRADLYAVDGSMDSALHWAAYKGSLPVCGLLLWYDEQHQQHRNNNNKRDLSELMAPDQYQQTPLHLAALRGHTSVVRYLLQRTAPTAHNQQELLFQKDHNGRTPLDLAIHKHRPTVQTVLQEAVDRFQARHHGNVKWANALRMVRQTFSLSAWQLWMGMSPASDEIDEVTKFPFYYLWFQGLVVHFCGWYPLVFCPFHTPAKGLLWDYPFWHLFNLIDMLLCMFFLYKTTNTSPGMLDGSEAQGGSSKQEQAVLQKYRKLYETTLESYAITDDMQKAIQQQPLCHTCHIARPLRSKHCRVSRSCVLMFDHHCPFVNNTVGLYNYPYFYLFLVTIALYLLGFWFNFGMYLYRSPSFSWWFVLLGIFCGLHAIPAVGMATYHTQLTLTNLTTNEHMNVSRYDYLYDRSGGGRRYRNPWFRGLARNFLDRLSPSDALYELPQLYRISESNNLNDADDEERQQRKGLLAHAEHNAV